MENRIKISYWVINKIVQFLHGHVDQSLTVDVRAIHLAFNVIVHLIETLPMPE